MTDIMSSVLEAIRQTKPAAATEISSSTIIASLELDSLDEVEVLMSLEDKYAIEIDQAEANGCKLLRDLASLIEQKVAQRRGNAS